MRYLFLALILLSPLAAQKAPDPVDTAREVQIYDARAALAGIGVVHGELLGAPAVGNKPDTSAAVDLHRRERLEDLVVFLRAALVPALTDPDDLQRLGGDLLVLRGAPVQQVALQRFLRCWSTGDIDSIEVIARIFKVPQQVFDASIAPALRLPVAAPEDGAASPPLVCGGESAAALELALKQGVGVEIMESPRLLLLPCQQGALSMLEKVYYRQDYLVEIENGKPKVWPVTGTIEDGVTLDVRAAPADAETTAVVVNLQLMELERPMPIFETTIGVNHKVVIDLPAVKGRRSSGALLLKAGQLGVLVAGGADDTHRTLLLIQCGKSER